VDAFKRIVERQLPGVQLKFRLERWTVREKIEDIISRLKEKGIMFFSQLFDEDRVIDEFIVTFLALLELVHLGMVKVFQSAPDGDIQLVPSFEENGETVDG
jgi:chromatin segregation and condensation protein Rec8/ScpA/Scc1 (kleisin family)